MPLRVVLGVLAFALLVWIVQMSAVIAHWVTRFKKAPVLAIEMANSAEVENLFLQGDQSMRQGCNSSEHPHGLRIHRALRGVFCDIRCWTMARTPADGVGMALVVAVMEDQTRSCG
jgi:hypothetical protein